MCTSLVQVLATAAVADTGGLSKEHTHRLLLLFLRANTSRCGSTPATVTTTIIIPTTTTATTIITTTTTTTTL
jgi:hypothetical protein